MLCTLDVVVLNLHCVVGYYQPPQGNQELIDEIVLVSEGEAFEQCRELARTEGLLVGISASAAVFAAREVGLYKQLPIGCGSKTDWIYPDELRLAGRP